MVLIMNVINVQQEKKLIRVKEIINRGSLAKATDSLITNQTRTATTENRAGDETNEQQDRIKTGSLTLVTLSNYSCRLVGGQWTVGPKERSGIWAARQEL